MRLSLLMLLLGLAACSPYSYSKEVSAISTGVTQLSNGFTSGYTALASDRELETQLTLTDTRARVSVATSCDDPTSKLPCGLYRFGGSAPALSAIEQDRSKTMEAIAVLKGYADALAAVTNAADRTAYDAAVAQLSGAVGTLAKTADPAAPGVSTVAPAFVNIIGWLVGTALDQQRFDSLKAAVTTVGTPQANGKAPIDTVATTLGAGLLALSLQRQAVLGGELDALIKPLSPTMTAAAYQTRLNDAQTTATVLDGLRKADPTAAAVSLTQAHAALLKAINDPTKNYPSLLKSVSDFADRAAALQAALAATAMPQNGKTKKG